MTFDCQVSHLIRDVVHFAAAPSRRLAMGVLDYDVGIASQPARGEGRLNRAALFQPEIAVRDRYRLTVELAQYLGRPGSLRKLFRLGDQNFTYQGGMIDGVDLKRGRGGDKSSHRNSATGRS